MKNNLSKIRKEKNLSQRELAEMIGVSHWWIGHIEQGKRKPSLTLMLKIAETLNVTLDDIFLFNDGHIDRKGG